MIEDTLDDFLEMIGGPDPTPKVPGVQETEDSALDFLDLLGPLSEVTMLAPTDVVEIRRQMLERYPSSNPAILDQWCRSFLHCRAALAVSSPAHKAAIHLCLQHSQFSEDQHICESTGHPYRGRGARIYELEELGFKLVPERDSRLRVRYRIDLGSFNELAWQRSQLTIQEKAEILRRSSGECPTCERPLAGESVEYDHRCGNVLQPATSIDDWQAICQDCNRKKNVVCNKKCPYGMSGDASHCGDCSWAGAQYPTHTAGGPVTLRLAFTEEELQSARSAGLSPKEWLRSRCTGQHGLLPVSNL